MGRWLRWVALGVVAPLAALVWGAGCLRFPPDLLYRMEMAPAAGWLAQPEYYFDSQDSTAVYQQEGFRLKVRFLDDAALNREYSRYTFRQPNLNPFTYGTDRDLDLGYTPPRFTLFQITAVNMGLPKVQVDPAQMQLRTDRGDVLEYWAVGKREAANNFEHYYTARRGEGGNEEYYYNERLGVVRGALYRRGTFIFGQEDYSGKVVFAPLHRDVQSVVLQVRGIVLRVDAFDRPKETATAEFNFQVSQGVINKVDLAPDD